MACNEDLVFGYPGEGRLNDERLRQMQRVMPQFDDGMPSHLVAAMIWLDEQCGLRQEGDYVLIQPTLAGRLLMEATFVNPAIQRAIEAEDEATLERLTGLAVFEMRFNNDRDVPAPIRGKVVRLRVMTRSEAMRLSFIYTVRATGEFIYLPGFESQLVTPSPRTVQELQ